MGTAVPTEICAYKHNKARGGQEYEANLNDRIDAVAPGYRAAGVDDETKEIYMDCLERSEEGVFYARNLNQKATDYVGVRQGRIVIRAELQLRYQHYFTDEEIAEAIMLIEGVRPHIEEFYARQGLALELTFHHTPYDSSSRTPHPSPPGNAYVVYIRRNTGEHMTSMYWGVNPDWEADARGSIYTHEFSHKLNLKDEYDTLLADRIGEKDNIMRDWNADNARFYPHQIRSLVSPLCDRTRLAGARFTPGGQASLPR